MADVWFYHLTRGALEDALTPLLEKSLERSWRAVVQVGSEARRDALDSYLWTYGDGTFLPHGTEAEGRAEDQPIWLTAGDDNPNGAVIRFYADGATPAGDLSGYERVALIFDGHDSDAVARARVQWKELAAANHQVTYWQQNDAGGWSKKG